MRVRNLPWHLLLPGVIVPTSIVTWAQYRLSVRATDDSPFPWYWYGGPFSALLNFPAFIYSAPAQTLRSLSFRVGKVWIEPRTVAFFLFVFVIWYWIGMRIETSGRVHPIHQRPSRIKLTLYGLGAGLWILLTVSTSYNLAFRSVFSSWHSLRDIYTGAELLELAQFLWSVALATYYCGVFVLGLRVRPGA
jgi:hypothetical protein